MANLTKEQRALETTVRPYRKVNAIARQKFLRALARTGNVTHSARHAGINASSIYAYAKKNPRFANRMSNAKLEFNASLETEAVRRGRDGYAKEVFQNGELVGYETRYSDRLLETALKANMPDRYAHNTVTVEGNADKPIALSAVQAKQDTTIDIDKLKQVNAGNKSLTLFEDSGQ